jgi:hypothetical protein
VKIRRYGRDCVNSAELHMRLTAGVLCSDSARLVSRATATDRSMISTKHRPDDAISRLSRETMPSSSSSPPSPQPPCCSVIFSTSSAVQYQNYLLHLFGIHIPRRTVINTIFLTSLTPANSCSTAKTYWPNKLI